MIGVSLLNALSDRARKAFQLAHQNSHRLGHWAVATAHLLLGLAKEAISPGRELRVLGCSGIRLAWLRAPVEKRHPRRADYHVPTRRSLAPCHRHDRRSYVEPIGRGAMLTTLQSPAALTQEPDGADGSFLRRRRLSWWAWRWLAQSALIKRHALLANGTLTNE